MLRLPQVILADFQKVVAGALLDSDILEQGLKLLNAELEEQILPDGGHYERTPMYHALVFEDLLLVQAALGPRGDFLTPCIAKMAAFLEGILPPAIPSSARPACPGSSSISRSTHALPRRRNSLHFPIRVFT